MSLWGTVAKVGTSLAGGLLGKKAGDKNVKMQKQFAKKGIQWKTQDALKAGIHPLYALGANTTSFSPISVGGTGSPMGNALADMGQDVGRAIDAGGNQMDRQMRQLALDRAGLENEKLKAEIVNINKSQLGPPSPIGGNPLIPGQGDIQGTPPTMFGGSIVPGDPKTMAAQEAEDAIGEIADQLAGYYWLGRALPVGWRDFWRTTGKELRGIRDLFIPRPVDRSKDQRWLRLNRGRR